MTKPENLSSHVVTLTHNDWKQLFDLLPEIKRIKRFGRLVGSQHLPDGTISLPYWAEEEVVSKVFNAAYFLGIVVMFDWAAWKEGIAILNDPDADYNKYDLSVLCKLLTIIIRSDKFCEGYMISCFETGTVTKIVEAMEAKTQ